jgi:NADH-quinone oxidoreductase subunit L
MLIPLFVLAFGSIFAGFFFREFFLGLGTPAFNNSIFVAFDATILDAEFLSPFLKSIPLFFTVSGYSLSFLFIYCFPLSKIIGLFQYKKLTMTRSFYTFLSKKWHFDQITNEFLIHRLMLFGDNVSFQILDKGNIERYGAFGAAFCTHNLSLNVSQFHSGDITHYLLTFILAILSVIFY